MREPQAGLDICVSAHQITAGKFCCGTVPAVIEQKENTIRGQLHPVVEKAA